MMSDPSSAMEARSARAFAGGALFAAWCATGFWLSESVALVRHSVTLGAAFERVFACAGFTVLWAMPLASMFGALCALGVAPRSDVPGPAEPAWFERLLGSGRDAGARVPTFGLMLVLFAAGSYLAANWAITTMHQVVFMALGIALIELLLLGVIALAYLPIYGIVRLALDSIARVAPRATVVLERPARMLLALAAVAAAALIAVLAARWETAQHLPWALAAKLGCSLGLGGAYLLVRRRITPSRKQLRVLATAAAVLAMAGLGVLASIDPARSDSAQTVQAETIGGSVGQRLLLALFDFDHDRHLGFAGGDDCAPRDPRIHPGAVDIIGNGVDEDCDGEDARRIRIPRGLSKYPVPDSVPAPRQIFLLTIDALQHDRIFAQDSGREVSPTLNALAKRSVYFDAAFSGGSVTRNAFPSLFTSRWDSQLRYTGAEKNPPGIDAHELMLAELLREQHFDTLAVLPNIYFFPSTWKGMTDGFDEIVELPGTSRFKGGIHNAAKVRQAAVDALGKRDPQAALFAWVHFFDAHTPYTVVRERGIGPFTHDIQGDYDSEVQLIDRELGTLLQFIEDHGFSNPLVIITADHGTSFDPRHTHPYGEDLYPDIVRVPLIVSGRGLAPRRVSTPVSTMDVAPTIANLLRTERKLPFEGVSLVPELTTGSSKVERILHQQLWSLDEDEPLRWASVNDARYHLVDDREHERVQLFEWRKDPFWHHDLSRDPQHARAQRHLQAALSQLLAEIDHDAPRATGSKPSKKHPSKPRPASKSAQDDEDAPDE
jgi:arylsulfatase A-like enzyme